MPEPRTVGPYTVRPCLGHWHITTLSGEDVINRFGDALDEETARRGAEEMNAEYLSSVEALEAETERLRAALAQAEREREMWKTTAVTAAVPLEVIVADEAANGEHPHISPTLRACIHEAVKALRAAAAPPPEEP